MHLKWRHCSHHTQIVHHQKTIAGQTVQSSTGETTRRQEISVDVEVREAPGKRIELLLHLKSAQVSEGDLVRTKDESVCVLK